MIDVKRTLQALMDDERMKAPTLRRDELVRTLQAAVDEIEWYEATVARLQARITRLEGLP